MKGLMRWLAATTVSVALVVGVVMVLLGMEPRPVLLVLVILVLAATAWLVTDLATTVSPLSWYSYGTEADTSARPDRRVQVLRSRLRQSPDRRETSTSTDGDDAEPSDEIIDSLLTVIDDHLRSEYGLDRSLDPDRAAAVLGPELARFATDPATRRSMTRRRTLARTVTLIEDL